MGLPELLIAGAQKCGTMTLHACLLSHAAVDGPRDPQSGAPVKEVNFFGNQWDRGLDWYRSHFRESCGTSIESTPNYLCDRRAHARIKEVVPHVRLIISLRDPVARAYSQFNHYSQNLEKTRNWDWAFPGESFDRNVWAELASPRSLWYGLVARGYYIDQLEHLFHFIPRAHVHIVIMEHWIRDPDPCFDTILEFAGLPQQRLRKSAAHMRPYTVDPLQEEVASQLRQIYRPYNERLFDLLGNEISEWG